MQNNNITIFETIDKKKIKTQIYDIRGFKVMLDSDITAYFGVTTANLNKAKNRNEARFPEYFAFTLTNEEFLIFQNGISKQKNGSGGRRKLPTVYTEQGVAMLTSCLHTDRVIHASIQIIEAFVEMRHYLEENRKPLPYKELYLYQIDRIF